MRNAREKGERMQVRAVGLTSRNRANHFAAKRGGEAVPHLKWATCLSTNIDMIVWIKGTNT